MLVSKKKYEFVNYLLSMEKKTSASYFALLCSQAELLKELDTLKASRARSNENLKLGTAASAKARRKKVEAASPLDWSKPIEAYHPDGSVVKVTSMGQVTSEYWTNENICGGVWNEDGTPWEAEGEELKWRIRNVA